MLMASNFLYRFHKSTEIFTNLCSKFCSFVKELKTLENTVKYLQIQKNANFYALVKIT